MNVVFGWRFFNSSAAGNVQIISPIPLYIEKMTGLVPVRRMTGKTTVTTYPNASPWRFPKDNRRFNHRSKKGRGRDGGFAVEAVINSQPSNAPPRHPSRPPFRP